MKHGCSAWSEDEFLSLDLGDPRLVRRLKAIAAGAADHPHGRINALFKNGAAKEAAYRFVENPRVDPESLIAASADAAMRRAPNDDVFVVVDQTSLSFPDPNQIRGLGRVGSDAFRKTARGIEVMSGLVLDDSGAVLGLASQEWLLRKEEVAPANGHDKRTILEKESVLWIRAMSTSMTNIRRTRPGARVTFLADRGCDVYGAFNAANCLGADFIIRSAQNRRLVDGSTLRDALRAAKPLGYITRRLRFKGHAGVEERLVRVAVRVVDVELDLHTNRTGANRGRSRLRVVRITEDTKNPSVSWTLLTTWKLDGLDDAIDVVDAYCHRWRVEDFHRAWKRGDCDVESAQLRSVRSIKCWATILAIVATRVERLKLLSRQEPDRLARDELNEDEIEALRLISGERRHWPQDWSLMTMGQAANLIAYLGGWGGRSQGLPGSTILGRGLERVEAAALVVKAMRERPSRSD